MSRPTDSPFRDAASFGEVSAMTLSYRRCSCGRRPALAVLIAGAAATWLAGAFGHAAADEPAPTPRPGGRAVPAADRPPWSAATRTEADLRRQLRDVAEVALGGPS